MEKKSKPAPLKQIRAGLWDRGFSLARMTAGAGASAAKLALGSVFRDDATRAQKLAETLLAQAGQWTREMGELKGSLMKVGQMLSMYGENLLPPEANALLKTLQAQSPPLEWMAIRRQLVSELGEPRLAELEVEEASLAAASIGQVHGARVRATGERLVLKIQYPGVDRAIGTDLKALRRILGLVGVLPADLQLDTIFEEIRSMLVQEMDYEQERGWLEKYARKLEGDARFKVPRALPAWCTRRVLAMERIEGVGPDSPEVLALSQEQRNALAEALLELYFRELLIWGQVQTDPHFGNFKVQLGGGPVWVLLDFGAVRTLPAAFVTDYTDMLRGIVQDDREAFEAACTRLGFLREGDPLKLRQGLYDLCRLIVEPFVTEGVYDWGASDLPKRVIALASSLKTTLGVRTPPPEILFLDRRLGGMFVLLAKLGAKFSPRPLLNQYILRS